MEIKPNDSIDIKIILDKCQASEQYKRPIILQTSSFQKDRIDNAVLKETRLTLTSKLYHNFSFAFVLFFIYNPHFLPMFVEWWPKSRWV